MRAVNETGLLGFGAPGGGQLETDLFGVTVWEPARFGMGIWTRDNETDLFEVSDCCYQIRIHFLWRTFKRWHRWGGGERRNGMAG
jgi:hypothetical protein